MNQILDHTQDISGTETHRLTSLHEPPEFVKEAEHTRLHGDPEMLPSHVYGDQTNRTWPLHAAPAVWMSSLFFFDKKASLDPAKADAIEQRILKAAQFYNIRPQVEKLKTKISESLAHDLSTVGDADFALVWESDKGKERHYPLRNSDEVKMAEHWFSQFRDEFLWTDRRRIAEKIYEKAAKYSVSLSDPEMITKTAGLGHAPTVDIIEMLATRANLVARTHPEHCAEIRKLAKIVTSDGDSVRGGISFRDTGIMDKIATVVDQFDRATNLNRMYDDGGLDRPEEVMFKLTAKHASDFVDAHIQMPSGTIYEKSAFEQLPLTHVKEWLGDEFADAISAGDMFVDPDKIAAIAPTLPRGDAELFDRMANAGGVPAYAVTKAAVDEGLTQNDIYALAAEYGNEVALSGDNSVL